MFEMKWDYQREPEHAGICTSGNNTNVILDVGVAR